MSKPSNLKTDKNDFIIEDIEGTSEIASDTDTETTASTQLEKPKKLTLKDLRRKRNYVMTPARKLAVEKMVAATRAKREETAKIKKELIDQEEKRRQLEKEVREKKQQRKIKKLEKLEKKKEKLEYSSDSSSDSEPPTRKKYNKKRENVEVNINLTPASPQPKRVELPPQPVVRFC